MSEENDATQQTTDTHERPAGHRSKAVIVGVCAFAVFLVIVAYAGIQRQQSLANNQLNFTGGDSGDENRDNDLYETEETSKKRGNALANMLRSRGGHAPGQTTSDGAIIPSYSGGGDMRTVMAKYAENENLQNQFRNGGSDYDKEERKMRDFELNALRDDISVGNLTQTQSMGRNSSQAGSTSLRDRQQSNSMRANSGISSQGDSIQSRRASLQRRMAEAQGQLASLRSGKTPSGAVVDPYGQQGESAGSLNTDKKMTGIGFDDAGRDPNGHLIPMATVIDGFLNQAVNTDHPGAFVGLIKHNVYSLDRRHVLIPQGSKVKGSVKTFTGPNKAINKLVSVGVEAIIRPDGSTIYLNDLTGLSLSGSGGIPGETDRHMFAQIMGTLAYAVIGVAPKLAFDGDTESTQDRAAVEVMDSVSRQTQQLASKYLNLVPTSYLKPGDPFKIVLDTSLMVSSYKTYDNYNWGNL